MQPTLQADVGTGAEAQVDSRLDHLYAVGQILSKQRKF